MPRPSRTQITAEYAVKIVRKLKAKESSAPGSGNAHTYYDVLSNQGKYLLSISLRHGARSQKYLGHDHMIGQLRINAYDAKRLAQCSLSRDSYLKAIDT